MERQPNNDACSLINFPIIKTPIFSQNHTPLFKFVIGEFSVLNLLTVGVIIIDVLNFPYNNHNQAQLYSQSLISKLNYPNN